MATKAQNKKAEVAQSPAPKVAAATPAVAIGSTTAAVAAPANGKSGGVNPPAANAKQVVAPTKAAVVKEEKKKMPDLKQKQDEYFKNLMSEVPGASFQEESENTVDKASKKVIDHIIYGHLNIQVRKTQPANHQPSSPSKKSDIIEGSIIEKKLQEAQKLKDDLKSQLSTIENRIDSLASQKIDNPKSLYSHPVMKQYMEDDAEKKRREATKFVKLLQIEKERNEEKIKQKNLKKQQLEESEAAQLARNEQRALEEKEKLKEESFKKRILQIKKRTEQRGAQLKDFEEKYFKKIKKDATKRPLFVRQRRKYRSEEMVFRENKLKEIQEKKKGFLSVAQIDFKAHEKKYFEMLHKLEAEKKSQREKQFEAICAKQPPPNLVYDSSKLFAKQNQQSSHLGNVSSDFDMSHIQNDEVAKANAKRIVEARQKFSEGLKQHQQILTSKQKQLELDIFIDKQENPQKYISLTKKKSSKQRYEEFAFKGRALRSETPNDEAPLLKSSASLNNFKAFQSHGNMSGFNRYGIKSEDEMIFKEQSKGGFNRNEAGREKEIGKMYLKSIKESILKHNEHMKNRQHNQHNLLDEENLEHAQTDRVKEADADAEENHPTNEQFNSTVDVVGNTGEKQAAARLVLPKIGNTNPYLTPSARADSMKDMRNSKSSNNNNNNPFKMENSLAESKQYPFTMHESVSTSARVASTQQQPKTNYMFEIRRKFNLGSRKEQWEKITEGSEAALPAQSKQKILQEASLKLDEDIKRREQLMKFSKSNELTLKEVQDRQELDDAYFKSIKAKIAFMKVTLDTPEAQQQGSTGTANGTGTTTTTTGTTEMAKGVNEKGQKNTGSSLQQQQQQQQQKQLEQQSKNTPQQKSNPA